MLRWRFQRCRCRHWRWRRRWQRRWHLCQHCVLLVSLLLWRIARCQSFYSYLCIYLSIFVSFYLSLIGVASCALANGYWNCFEHSALSFGGGGVTSGLFCIYIYIFLLASQLCHVSILRVGRLFASWRTFTAAHLNFNLYCVCHSSSSSLDCDSKLRLPHFGAKVS